MTALIEARDLTKRFGGIVAVRALHLAVQPGELVGLIGPNGSGKTTTINLLTGHLKPAAGEVFVRGGRADGLAPSAFAALRVGRTFQITQLFGRMSVLENMLVPGLARPHSKKPAALRAARQHLEFLGLAALEKLPAKHLSGGQQKLLELGRALMLDPDILFLDEPFAGVNPFLRDEIIVLVQKLHAQGRTFVIVDHDIQALQRLVLRLVVMARGEKIADGPVDQVRNDQEVLRAYAEFDAAPVLTARDLVAGYLPGIHILNGMSVDVLAGQVRCVLGPNGTGKSTLLKVLFGFLPALSGDMRLGEVSLAGLPAHRMGALGITYLPQRPSLFPFLSVEVNLRLGTWSFRRDRALARQRIEQAYTQFPILSERRRQAAGTLSGGQQRQLEIARALLTDPKVMLIDEPTASIEPRIAAQIYTLIAGLAHDAGKAILLVDQNISGALGIADHVYVMRTGSLLEAGPRGDFVGDVETLVARWLYTR